MRVIVEPGGALLATARQADTALSRMIGLLGRRSLEAGDGMVFTPCSSIHTWFMKFAIDILFVDRVGTVVRAVDSLRPFRLALGGWSARTAVELPAGTLRRIGVEPGQRVRIETA